MPLPSPDKGETKAEWIERCMGNDAMKGEFPKDDQRLAVCNQKWTDKDKASAEAEDGREVRLSPAAELRVLDVELRAEQGGKGLELVGYASKFNIVAETLPGLYERVAPGAFTQTIAEGDDVRMLFNHNPDIVLGRTKAGTLRLEEDDVGLRIRNWPPKTTAAADLLTNIKEGNVTQMSIAFRKRDHVLVHNDDGTTERTLTNMELLDVSAVTYPAFNDTDIALRSRAEDTRVVTEMMKDWAAKTDITKTAEPEPKAADKDDGPKLAKDDPNTRARLAAIEDMSDQAAKQRARLAK